MNIEELISQNTIDGKFIWGIDTVMKSIRPGCLYSLQSVSGEFIITSWEENQWSDKLQSYITPPTSREIRDEYIRQQTIAECLEYFKKESTD